MRRLIKKILLSNVISLAQLFFNSFKSRVIGNSGVVEAESCVVTTLSNLDAKNLLQSATFVLAPSGYKSGLIYSQVPSNGNGDLTFTRATTATRVNSSGIIETVASGVPKLDYSLGGCPNFLFEPQRVNYALNSDTGTTQTISVTNGRVYYLSFYGTGSITYSGAASGTLNGTGANNRVGVAITAGASAITLTVTGTVTYLQFEGSGGTNPANYPTSYIPTISVAATRNAESFTRGSIYTNGLIGASGGTWFIELKNNLILTRDNANRVLCLGNSSLGTGTHQLFMYNSSGTGRLALYKNNAGGIGTSVFTTTSDNIKLAITWNSSTNVLNVYQNGIREVIDSAFTVDNASNPMEFLVLPSAGGGVPAYISQMVLWNTALSHAQCIALTS